MKILMLDPSAVNPYGTDLSCALSDCGLDVLLMTSVNHEYNGRIRCRYLRIAPRSSEGQYLTKAVEELRYISTILFTTLSWKPSIVHIQWPRFRLEAWILRLLRYLGPRVIITGHNVLPHERHSGDVSLYRRYYSIAHRIIVHEASASLAMQSTFGIPQNRVTVVPFGMQPLMPGRLVSREVARRTLGISEELPTFLLFGGLRPYKGFEELLTAFQESIREGLTAQLVVAGWASRDMARKYQAILRTLDIPVQERVISLVEPGRHLSTAESDLVFSASDCVVLPYRHISQSSVLFQAFSYGKPVIVTRVGGFADVVEHGESGLVVDPDDQTALSQALLCAASDLDRLRKWGTRARNIALERFTWDRIAARTIDVYKEALGE